MEIRVISNITKEYSDMLKIVSFKQPKYYALSPGAVKRPRDIVRDSDYIPKYSSLHRTKSLVQDLVLCNDFEYFCTFTFDKRKVSDRYSFHCCYSVMSRWINNQRDNAREKGSSLKYLIIPEKHKDGAWHFHALISGFTGSLKDSKRLTSTGQPIFNITSFRSGFSTAVPIVSREGVSTYVSKYITKELIKDFNQRRFFCSRGLIRPVRTLNSNYLNFCLPLWKSPVVDSKESYTFIIPKIALDKSSNFDILDLS